MMIVNPNHKHKCFHFKNHKKKCLNKVLSQHFTDKQAFSLRTKVFMLYSAIGCIG